MEHPNIDKLNENTEAWNKIFPFIEWLHENNMWIAEEDPVGQLFSIRYTTEILLYKYFNVDPGELESERRQVLDEVRARQS